MRSASSLCFASKVRYMHAHQDIITPLYHQLLGSCDNLPLSSFPLLSRPFWDSSAICSNIFRASKGQGFSDDDADLAVLINKTVQEVSSNRAKGKVQSAIYNLIRSRFHSCDLFKTIINRCNKYLSITLNSNEIDFLQVFSVANALGSQVGYSLLKTVIGAWITNRRIQSNERPCIFCGLGQDSCNT